ncbi:MAG TPA: DUF2231 domain-containing protein [Pyrinomonadaceae bacterium]|nr:DUF2231 domain-containing protein [Pyrinomonadaceae bacterium]HEU4836513.1 DUF2231 domain-containing protein [Pyrinomonadaceae bacterium]
MKSKASIGGHPVHPMIIPFPLALWTTSFVVDVLFYFLRHPTLLVISKFMLGAGCLGAVVAAIPGIVDWSTIKNGEVKKAANWHARLNIAALVVFAISFFLRLGSYSELVGRKLTIPFLLSLVGMILISISGWLGGELVFRYGVGQTDSIDSSDGP